MGEKVLPPFIGQSEIRCCWLWLALCIPAVTPCVGAGQRGGGGVPEGYVCMRGSGWAFPSAACCTRQSGPGAAGPDGGTGSREAGGGGGRERGRGREGNRQRYSEGERARDRVR